MRKYNMIHSRTPVLLPKIRLAPPPRKCGIQVPMPFGHIIGQILTPFRLEGAIGFPLVDFLQASHVLLPAQG